MTDSGAQMEIAALERVWIADLCKWGEEAGLEGEGVEWSKDVLVREVG